jgi:archaellum component FlaC
VTSSDDLGPRADRAHEDASDDLRKLALAMERMAGEMATLKSRLDRIESLLEGVANRMAVVASRNRHQPATKDDLQPVLAGLLQLLEQKQSLSGNDGRKDRS